MGDSPQQVSQGGRGSVDGEIWLPVALDLPVMLARTVKVLASLSLFELVVFVLFANWFGLLRVAFVVVALSVAGMLYLTNKTPAFIRSGLNDIAAGATSGHGKEYGDKAIKVTGGLLLAYPGLFTGFVGALLFIGPVRSALRPVFSRWLVRLVPVEASQLGDFAGAFRRRDAVDVTYRTKDSSNGNASDGTQPELPGRSA